MPDFLTHLCRTGLGRFGGLLCLQMLFTSQTVIACNNSPVFAFSRAVYQQDYSAAQSYLASIEQQKGETMARFLTATLAWKQAYDSKEKAEQGLALDRIDALINSGLARLQDQHSQEALLLGNLSIHAARLHLLMGNVVRAAKLAQSGYAVLSSAHLQNPDNPDLYLALGLYEYYAGSENKFASWIKSMFDLQGDQIRGRELIERAVRESPDYAFEAMRSLVMELNWQKPQICEYPGAVLELVSPDSLPFEAQQQWVSIALFCEQGEQALSLINEIGKENQSEIDKAQDLWLENARLHALALKGDLEMLSASHREHTDKGDQQSAAHAQFAMAKVHDLRGARSEALTLYQAVLDSRAHAHYKQLARQYIERPYRGSNSRVASNSDQAPPLRLACR